MNDEISDALKYVDEVAGFSQLGKSATILAKAVRAVHNALGVTDYAALEREHLGDSDKGTGIYSGNVADTPLVEETTKTAIGLHPWQKQIISEVVCEGWIRHTTELASLQVTDERITLAITRLERQDSTQEERFAAADGLRALLSAPPAAAMPGSELSDPQWKEMGDRARAEGLARGGEVSAEIARFQSAAETRTCGDFGEVGKGPSLPDGAVAEIIKAASQEAKPVAAVNGVRWDLFPGYLIDNFEGEEIFEERLQSALADMLSSDSYKAAIAAAPQ